MAQAALTNWQNMMTERMLSEQLVFGFEHPLLSLLTGLDKGTDYIVTRDPNQQRFTRAMDVGKELFSRPRRSRCRCSSATSPPARWRRVRRSV
jgi:hypothetical protein